MNLDPARCEWRKSRASSNNNACVEATVRPDVVGIRDTKDRPSGHLAVHPTAWAAFLQDVREH
jgi:hypothetical protein